ncbi:casein kinase substrate phosphoprotein PP28-domain-containing protein [Rhodofomes roseus]|uniref:Casein kinase substrate phosphoprotein PP28-domain-containing protein n=1 Tax=Rhodofomes roseus TaxID=34475 RepID=A0ABQ8KIK2_9APHY|nr:casein kinase substrate phosphoprotein PP28-domain-containing protein [Rhodofomes roseus]KAH9837701.1 casein kinase substrate phosphoprotein PP28-domain-containing protein [Rhodofomes roseus]
MARGGYKVKRGGGRSFSKHLELDENGTAVSTDKKWVRRDKAVDEESDEESEEEEEEESEEEPAEATSSNQPQQELTRAERRELKKKKGQQKQDGEEDEDSDQDPLLANPNIAAGKKLAISDIGAPRELTRRERDEKEKKEAKERYWKLHEQGKTEEAKSDLARLAKIRAEREAAQAKRKAEAEAKAAELEAKKREAAAKGKRI